MTATSPPGSSAARRALGIATGVAASGGRRRPGVERRIHRLRARALESRIRVLAAWVGAEVDVTIGAHVQVGRRIVVVIEPGTSTELHIGEGCHLDDDVRLQLKGGRIVLDPWVQLRRGVLLNSSGSLTIGARTVVSWYTVIHCSNEVRIGKLGAIGEFVTIVDSSHYYVEPSTWVADNIELGTCEIGDNTWIATKATVPSGSTVGSWCIVAAHAVVRGEVPDGHLAAGVPAAVRPLDLPWRRSGQPGPSSSE